MDPDGQWGFNNTPQTNHAYWALGHNTDGAKRKKKMLGERKQSHEIGIYDGVCLQRPTIPQRSVPNFSILIYLRFGLLSPYAMVWVETNVKL